MAAAGEGRNQDRLTDDDDRAVRRPPLVDSSGLATAWRLLEVPCLRMSSVDVAQRDRVMQTTRTMVRGGVPHWDEEPLVWLSVALVLGVALVGPYVLCPAGVWSGSVALFLLGALAGARRGSRCALLSGAILLGAALGAPRSHPPLLPRMALIQGVVRSVSGRTAVVEHPEGSTRLWFSGRLPAPGQAMSARTRQMPSDPRLPGAPDRRRPDRRLGRPRRWVIEWVAIGAEAAEPIIPSTFLERRYGGLMWSLATGHRDALREEDAALLRRTGTAHLLAISGMHIGFVAALGWVVGRGLLAGLARCRPRWTGWRRWTGHAALPGVLAAVGYADLVDWPVSARRAVVMVVGAAVARLLGRRLRPWSLLALAAIGVVLLDPDAVFGLGFGLSFGAVSGILLVTPRLLRWLPPDPPWAVARAVEGMAVSVGAMAGTLPLSLWWFQSVSPLGPVANLVACPLLGGVGVPAALLAAHGPALATPLALWTGDRAMAVAFFLLERLDVVPWTPAVGPAGALLLALAIWLRRHPVPCVVVVMGALFLPTVRPVDGMEITVLAVGQGDAIFIRLPDGRRWLFDGGPPSSRVLEWLRREGHNHLDTVFLSHPDSDHLGGLVPVIESLSVGRFVTTRPPRLEEAAYRAVWQTLHARQVPIEGPDWQPDGPGRIVHPRVGWREDVGASGGSGDNDNSLVVVLEHAGHRVLLSGDIERSAERWLAPKLPPVDVLLAPHHGSRSSSSAPLVVATDPTWVVISCGRDNRYGHPHAGTLAQWRGRRVLRTDRNGTLRLRLRASGLQVEQWSAGEGYALARPWRWEPRPLSPKLFR